jgi:uncharacterized SAM-binding protein YcdF (DUF218 family)
MHFPYFLKKLLEGVLMPFPLSLLIIAVGTILLWLNRAGRSAKYTITVGIGMLMIVSNPWVAYHLVHNLEARYPPVPAELVTNPGLMTQHTFAARNPNNVEQLQILSSKAPLVVVLGGGGNDDPELPESKRMSSISAVRLVTAVQIIRCMMSAASAAHSVEQPRMILSGAAGTEAIPMEKLAESLGIPADDIVLETRSDDTRTQAEDIFAMVGNQPFILVTSAIHMPRAVALFRHLGMRPVPLPANYLATMTPVLPVMNVLPNVDALYQVTAALHERLGMVWEHLRGES